MMKQHVVTKFFRIYIWESCFSCYLSFFVLFLSTLFSIQVIADEASDEVVINNNLVMIPYWKEDNQG